jgi:hypothetical protein
VANGQRVVLVQKQPEINRVEYIKPKYNSRLYSDAESETDSSSETDNIYYRDNVRLARAAPPLTGNNRRVIIFYFTHDHRTYFTVTAYIVVIFHFTSMYTVFISHNTSRNNVFVIIHLTDDNRTYFTVTVYIVVIFQ